MYPQKSHEKQNKKQPSWQFQIFLYKKIAKIWLMYTFTTTERKMLFTKPKGLEYRICTVSIDMASVCTPMQVQREHFAFRDQYLQFLLLNLLRIISIPMC